jgi:hypothetical protein
LNASGAVIRRISITAYALAVCLIFAAAAQPVARPPSSATPQPVGASEIFDALTQADAPSDLQRLRALRDSLTGNPDLKTLADMRVQVDTLLRDAEHRQGETPPALVMSGIASRIDTAMTRMETTHPAPIIPAFPGPPWLLPALAALCGTLAIALAVCVAAMAAQGRSTEESDDVRETLTKIKRKLEDALAGNRKTKDLGGEAGDEPGESLQETAAVMNRLQNVAKEAETVLRAATEAAEQRLQGAVAVASQLETWLEELPHRLNEALAQAEGIDTGPLEGPLPSVDRAFLLQDFLGSLQEACDEMRATTASLAQQNLAGLQTQIGETSELASEMTHLSYGHALKLEDVIGQLAQATEGLPELARILAEATAHMPQQIERTTAVTDIFETASLRADAAWVKLSQFVETMLPEILAAMADAVSRKGIAALGTASQQCESVAKVAADTAASLPAQLNDAVTALSDANEMQKTAMEDAILRLANLAEILPEAGTSLAASSEALKRHVVRDAKREAVTRAAIGEISAAAHSARADLAATADAVAAMPAQNDRLSDLLTHAEQLLAGLETKAADEADSLQQARNEALAGVELAIGKMQMAAERLHAGADAQEQALARVRRAALTVATLAGADSGLLSVDHDPMAQTG